MLLILCRVEQGNLIMPRRLFLKFFHTGGIVLQPANIGL